MQLVSKAKHDADRHTGGLAIWRRVIGYYEIANDAALAAKWKYKSMPRDYPLCCPTDEQRAEAKARREEAEKKKKKK